MDDGQPAVAAQVGPLPEPLDAVDALRGRPHGWLTQDDEARAGVLDGWRMVASARSRNQRRARVFRAAVRLLESFKRN